MAEYWERLMDQHHEFKSPFICNIEFTAPSRFPDKNKQIVAKNVNHIEYIGTRSGVVTAEEEAQVSTNAKPLSLDDGLDINQYFNYLDERPGSHGLFSSSDENPDPKSIKEELAEHNGVVWRVVLSLTEEDAKRLDYTSRAKWENTLRTTVPEAAAKMKIGETNLRWVAAYHHEAGHPHVHIALWEKTVKRRRGTLSPHEVKEVKKAFQKEVYAEERAILFQQKTLTRDLIREMSRNELTDAVSIVRSIQEYEEQFQLEANARGAGKVGVNPTLQNETRSELATRLTSIAEHLPEKGRIAYKLMEPELKERISETAKWLIHQPAFYETRNGYMKAVEAMTKHFSFQEKDIHAAKENALFDLERRVSQVVLRAAVETQRRSFMIINEEKASQAIEQIMLASGSPLKDDSAIIPKLTESFRSVGMNSNQQEELMRTWAAHAGMAIESTNLKNIIEQIEMSPARESSEGDLKASVTALRSIEKSAKDIVQLLQNHFEVKQIEEAIAQVDKQLVEEKTFTMTETEWKRFTNNLGVAAQYPWNQEEVAIVLSEHREAVKEGFLTAKLDTHLDIEAKGYTAYCMTVALKQLGVESSEREKIMHQFADSNEIDGIGRILSTIDENKTSYLKKTTWERINQNLKLELPYPWLIDQTLQLDRDNFEKAFVAINGAGKELTEKEALFTGQRLYQFLNLNHGEADSRIVVNDWSSKAKVDPAKLELDVKHQTDPLAILHKAFNIKDPVEQTVHQMTRVLLSAGLTKEQGLNIVQDWNQRSGANIPESKLSKWFEKEAKRSSEDMVWGRTPVLRKEDFKQMCSNLKIKAPYMWEGKNQSHSSSAMNNIAKSLWKNVWQALEQERMKSHAQGEMLKRQMIRQQQRAASQQQENE